MPFKVEPDIVSNICVLPVLAGFALNCIVDPTKLFDGIRDEEKLVFLEFIELDTYAILDMLTNKATDDIKYKNILLALKSLN